MSVVSEVAVLTDVVVTVLVVSDVAVLTEVTVLGVHGAVKVVVVTDVVVVCVVFFFFRVADAGEQKKFRRRRKASSPRILKRLSTGAGEMDASQKSFTALTAYHSFKLYFRDYRCYLISAPHSLTSSKRQLTPFHGRRRIKLLTS